jgi:hypothetical protein
MEKRKLTCANFLFPNGMKTIGIVTILSGIILFFIAKPLGLIVSFPGWYIIATGLFVFALSKEKQEDEMIESIRLRSFLISTIGVIAFVMTYDLIMYLDGSLNYINAIQIICLQLFIHTVWFRYEMSRIK